jgi:hypothetical protein
MPDHDNRSWCDGSGLKAGIVPSLTTIAQCNGDDGLS